MPQGNFEKSVSIRASSGKRTIHLDAETGLIHHGGNGVDGKILLKTKAGSGFFDMTIVLDGSNGNITLISKEGKRRINLETTKGNIWLGGNDEDGDLVLFDREGDNKSLSKSSIHLNGQRRRIKVGGNGKYGSIVVKDSSGKNAIVIENHMITLGKRGTLGTIELKGVDGKKHIELHGNGYIYLYDSSGKSRIEMREEGELIARNSAGKDTVRIEGESGSILLKRDNEVHINLDTRSLLNP